MPYIVEMPFENDLERGTIELIVQVLRMEIKEGGKDNEKGLSEIMVKELRVGSEGKKQKIEMGIKNLRIKRSIEEMSEEMVVKQNKRMRVMDINGSKSGVNIL